MSDITKIFDKEEILDKFARQTLKEICVDLVERGYNPIQQITGYLMSGDPGYISSYKECRRRILEINREDIIELMVKNYIS